MPIRGNSLPQLSILPLPGTRRGVPPLIPVQYTLISLHKCSFLTPFGMGVHQKVRNKIQKKYQALQNQNRGRSR